MHFMRLFEPGECGHRWEFFYGRPKHPKCLGCGSRDALLGLFHGQLESAMLGPHHFS